MFGELLGRRKVVVGEFQVNAVQLKTPLVAGVFIRGCVRRIN